MRRVIPLVVTALLAIPALAGDGYRFHLRVTDGRTGLLANPRLAELKLTNEQLARAANDRVLVLDHVTGAHFVWLMLGWPPGTPAPEPGFNLHGGAKPGKDADLTLTPGEDSTVRVRCLREHCTIHVTAADRKETMATLTNERTADFPLDSDFDLTFQGR